MPSKVKLAISEITNMGTGFCVIGLEKTGQAIRSVRPMPPQKRHSWDRFPYKRGDILDFDFLPTQLSLPHVEDRQTLGREERVDQIPESELVNRLRHAEIAAGLPEFFGCELRASLYGGKAIWVHPREASRSICGCEFENYSFRIIGGRIRVALSLPQGDSLESLPLVDRDWYEFILLARARIGGADARVRVEQFLNEKLHPCILHSADSFARVGIARPDETGCCWLMLDSLFPGPRKEWLEELL